MAEVSLSFQKRRSRLLSPGLPFNHVRIGWKDHCALPVNRIEVVRPQPLLYKMDSLVCW